jgi:hypothetical protein
MKRNSIFNLTAAEVIALAITIATLVAVVFLSSSRGTAADGGRAMAAADSIEAALHQQDTTKQARPASRKTGKHKSGTHKSGGTKSKTAKPQTPPRQRNFLDESVSE